MLIADTNADFNSNHQQDALEYLQWLFDRLDKEEPKFGQPLPRLFNFSSVNQLVCTQCQGYKQVKESTNEWKFPVPPPTQQEVEQFYKNL